MCLAPKSQHPWCRGPPTKTLLEYSVRRFKSPFTWWLLGRLEAVVARISAMTKDEIAAAIAVGRNVFWRRDFRRWMGANRVTDGTHQYNENNTKDIALPVFETSALLRVSSSTKKHLRSVIRSSTVPLFDRVLGPPGQAQTIYCLDSALRQQLRLIKTNAYPHVGEFAVNWGFPSPGTH